MKALRVCMLMLCSSLLGLLLFASSSLMVDHTVSKKRRLSNGTLRKDSAHTQERLEELIKRFDAGSVGEGPCSSHDQNSHYLHPCYPHMNFRHR